MAISVTYIIQYNQINNTLKGIQTDGWNIKGGKCHFVPLVFQA